MTALTILANWAWAKVHLEQLQAAPTKDATEVMEAVRKFRQWVRVKRLLDRDNPGRELKQMELI